MTRRAVRAYTFRMPTRRTRVQSGIGRHGPSSPKCGAGNGKCGQTKCTDCVQVAWVFCWWFSTGCHVTGEGVELGGSGNRDRADHERNVEDEAMKRGQHWQVVGVSLGDRGQRRLHAGCRRAFGPASGIRVPTPGVNQRSTIFLVSFWEGKRASMHCT